MVLLVTIIVIALAFDFTNGFHDTANAIATTVSTRALRLRVAVAMAAVMNLVGALVGQKVAQTVGKGIIAINSLENDGDRIEREAITSLFDGDMKCTDIIKWKDIYEILEAAIDECEHVANVIESIVLKYN